MTPDRCASGPGQKLRVALPAIVFDVVAPGSAAKSVEPPSAARSIPPAFSSTGPSDVTVHAPTAPHARPSVSDALMLPAVLVATDQPDVRLPHQACLKRREQPISSTIRRLRTASQQDDGRRTQAREGSRLSSPGALHESAQRKGRVWQFVVFDLPTAEVRAVPPDAALDRVGPPGHHLAE